MMKHLPSALGSYFILLMCCFLSSFLSKSVTVSISESSSICAVTIDYSSLSITYEGMSLIIISFTGCRTQICRRNLTGLNGNIYFNVQSQPTEPWRFLRFHSFNRCSWQLALPIDKRKFILIFRLSYINNHGTSDRILLPDASTLEFRNISFFKNILCKMYATSSIPSRCIEEVQKQACCPNVTIATIESPAILKASTFRRDYNQYEMQFIIGYWLHFCPESVNSTTDNFNKSFERFRKVTDQDTISTQNPITDKIEQNNSFNQNLIIVALGTLTLLCGIVITVLVVLLRKQKMKHSSSEKLLIANLTSNDDVEHLNDVRVTNAREVTNGRVTNAQETAETSSGYLCPIQSNLLDGDYVTIEATGANYKNQMTSSPYVNNV